MCAVTTIVDQSLPLDHPDQSYGCEEDIYLDDPYEGELLTYFLHHFSDLSDDDKDSLWEFKRAKMASVEYDKGGVGPITVQEGAHSPSQLLSKELRANGGWLST